MGGRRVYGIDLGTTYSSIAHVDERGKPTVLPNTEGELTTPSVVFFENADNVVVGQAAKDAARIHPERCVTTVKRVMGDPHWEQVFSGQVYKPQDVSSFILRKLASDARRVTGQDVDKVVITCPAYFGPNEKEATRQAGALAGLDVQWVIPEPTAAALAYGMELSEDQVVMVYDLGGGTFDVTVIDVCSGEIRVVSTGGDDQLGGKDWDESIVGYFVQSYAEEMGLAPEELLEDAETYQYLLQAAERSKKALSTLRSVVEPVHFDGERVEVELSRETFDRLTAHLLERTLSLTDHQIETARARGVDRIDKLLLVGGSTSMPQVLDAVRARYRFAVEPFDPVQAVAKGAALYGYRCYLGAEIEHTAAASERQGTDDRESIERQVAEREGLESATLRRLTGRTVRNVAPKSFGIQVVNARNQQVVTNLIEVNDPVPCRVTQRFATYEEGQVEAVVVCMESTLHGREELLPGDCTELGRAVMEFGRPLARGAPVEITFELTEEGRLTVTGRELTTGATLEARFITGGVLSQTEEAKSRQRNLAIRIA